MAQSHHGKKEVASLIGKYTDGTYTIWNNSVDRNKAVDKTQGLLAFFIRILLLFITTISL